MATFTGFKPTATVATTTLLPVSITETEAEPAFATYAFDPFGVSATLTGLRPTGITNVTVLLAVLMTDTEFEPAFVT
jgi:hypothetical protein